MPRGGVFVSGLEASWFNWRTGIWKVCINAGVRPNFAYSPNRRGWLEENGNFRVLVRFVVMRKQSLYGVVGLALVLGAGCASPGLPSDREAAGVEAPQIQVPLTPDQEKEKTDAHDAYVTCLREAAQYAKTRASTSGDEAALIAPMCYPQFLRFEIASTAGMANRDRRAFDREGDERQVEFAADAIHHDQGLAALTPGK